MPHGKLFWELTHMEKPYKKRRGDRRDARWLREEDSLHQITPYLMPNRCDNEAFIKEQIDLTAINAYIAKKNLEDPDFHYTFFHIIVAALVKTVTLRPRMNRFIQGMRLYQRDDLTAAFVVKKQFSDSAKEALAYIRFEDTDTVDTIHRKIKDEVQVNRRADTVDNSTDGMNMLVRLPRFVLRFVMWLLRRLDFYGKAPYSLVKTDPDYASIFLSNLGSIKLNAGYHHLNNWGTNSLFVTIGEKHLAPFYNEAGQAEMREVLELGMTLDERIADGYYYSRTVKLLKHLLQHPELLETPAKEEVAYE